MPAPRSGLSGLSIGVKLNAIIILLLVATCVVITGINNYVARQSLKDQLFNEQLPAVADNILDEVDSSILEPAQALALVAQNPFFLRWIEAGEPEADRPLVYDMLAATTKTYSTLGSNYVSWKTKNYYDYSDGKESIKQVDIAGQDSWFPAFKDSGDRVGINVYVNHEVFGSIAFINRRIGQGEFLGLTSVALAVEAFVENVTSTTVGEHGVTYMCDADGIVRVHADTARINAMDITTVPGLAEHAKKLLNAERHSFSYAAEGDTVYVTSRHIPELDWYLVTEAKGSDLFADMNAALYTTIGVGVVLVLLGVAAGVVFVRGIAGSLRRTMRFARAVADGDLDEELDVVRGDEIGQLSNALRVMVGTLKDKIREVTHKTQEAEEKARVAEVATWEAEEARRKAESARCEGMLAAAQRLEDIVDRVTAASEEIETQSREIHQGADIQSERVASTATAMEEMNATVLEVAKNSSEAAEVGKDAQERARQGMDVARQSIRAMETTRAQAEELKQNMTRLGEQAESIGNVMNVITDIADQTNLLALNAAIEAARAGEAGRGFAVVADEVRKLAEKTMTATKEVGQAITAIQTAARENMDSMDRAVTDLAQAAEYTESSGQALESILSQVEASAAQIQSIATAAEEQSASSEEITNAVSEISRITSDTARGAAETAQAVSDLSEQTRRLAALIDELKAEGDQACEVG